MQNDPYGVGAAFSKLTEAARTMGASFSELANSIRKFHKETEMLRITPIRSRRQTNQNKNGMNKSERRHNQVMLKGRGKRNRTGVYPGRGKGRTAHGRRH